MIELKFDVKGEPVLLRSSEMCYEICRQRTRIEKDTGAEVDYWEPHLYPATLENGLTRIMDMKIKAANARTLAELKAVVEAARYEICCVWNTRMEGIR
jgi:hypothetical protein